MMAQGSTCAAETPTPARAASARIAGNGAPGCMSASTTNTTPRKPSPPTYAWRLLQRCAAQSHKGRASAATTNTVPRIRSRCGSRPSQYFRKYSSVGWRRSIVIQVSKKMPMANRNGRLRATALNDSRIDGWGCSWNSGRSRVPRNVPRSGSALVTPKIAPTRATRGPFSGRNGPMMMPGTVKATRPATMEKNMR